MHRKYLIFVLGNYRKETTAAERPGGRADNRGRKAIYGQPDFLHALRKCWRATNHSCAENLQPYLPELVPKLMACGELEVSGEARALLLRASTSTIARALKRFKTKDHVPMSTTRPGKLLKSMVAIRRGRWDETLPGSVETDTVAHCGEANAGTYIHSYNFVDIATSWSEQVAAMGMGERATVAAISSVRTRFPFPLTAIDSDNGAEFLNYHLQRYCQSQDITFTRSRPYQKNDNAHIEQKNNAAIRKMVGYRRYDNSSQLDLLNRLYSEPLRLYLNFCQPTRKRKTKEVDTATGKKRQTYFEARTPYQRVMESPHMDKATKELLQSQYNNLNPVKLLAEIQEILGLLGRGFG
jgi:hypothetical protein